MTSPDDPRARAFCSADGPAVFDGVVYGSQIWSWDPFDVPMIHAEARQIFEQLLTRAAGLEGAPESGRMYLLLGEAGSGKTHLLRAFRQITHGSGRGYCGYVQLTSRTDDYAHYLLAHLVDGLEVPYARSPDRDEPASTGLGRLAEAVLDAAGVRAQRRTLEEAAAPAALAEVVYGLADEIVRHPRFATVDVDLLRVLLFALSRDPRVRARASKWLRCEDLSRFDREWLGDLVPRTGPEMPRRQILALGKLMAAVDSALVLLVDQMEGVVELVEDDGLDPSRLLRRVLTTLISLADALPNAVVVLACLEELFAVGRSRFPVPVLHRLERDPEPIRLGSRRTVDQIEAIVARRLGVLYGDRGVPIDRADPIAPYTRSDLEPLVAFGGRTRDMLHFLQQHRRRCVAAGRFVPPEGSSALMAPSEPGDVRTSQRWNDFLAGWRLGALSEARMADLLAWAAQTVHSERGDDRTLDARADGRFVELDLGAGQGALLAVVDDSANGEALGRSFAEGEARAGNRPAVFVRSTDFPAPAGAHRTLVVQNSDWRALEALREFSSQNRDDAGFAEWMRHERPLSARPAIQELLELASDAPLEVAAPAAESGPFRIGSASEWGTASGPGTGEVRLDPQTLGHVALFGGPRTGRTTAALVLAEALLVRGIPVVIVERKGVLARYVDPAAWSEPMDDARRAERRATFLARTHPRLWTPGAPDGRPLAVGPLPTDVGVDPPFWLPAAALGGWMDYRAKVHEPKVEVLRRAIRLLVERDQPVTVPALRALVSVRDPRVVRDGEQVAADRVLEHVERDLGTLWLRKRWLLDGDERIDVARMLRRTTPARGDRANLEILYTRPLEQDADFWVAQLLLGFVAWCRAHPRAEADGPRAALILDDLDAHLVPSALPSVRAALRALLGSASAAGLSIVCVCRTAVELGADLVEAFTKLGSGRFAERLPKGALPEVFGPHAGALAKLKPGELVLPPHGPVAIDYNLIPSRPQPESWVLGLARDGRIRREDTRWLG